MTSFNQNMIMKWINVYQFTVIKDKGKLLIEEFFGI